MKPLPKPKTINELIGLISADRLRAILESGMHAATHKGRYLHWDKLRHLKPPNNLTSEEWWFQTKLARSQNRHPLPLADARGTRFTYMMADPVQEMLHKIDQKAGGQIAFPDEATNPNTRDRYILNSLIEEAITSSQIEGASTTRVVASEMIRSGRRPRDKSERMILNNFQAIIKIRKIVNNRIQPQHVLELHKILTEDTLENPDDAGRLQTENDKRVQVVDNVTHHTLFVPPPAGQLPKRLENMCMFANGTIPSGRFVHPVIRSIMLHFWLGHDHPFIDGNGRTARALFYWSMLSHGYWLFEYVSISTILKNAFAQYGRSYLYTESDENDATYFIIHHLNVILKAIEQLESYLKTKVEQLKAIELRLRGSSDLNHRQLAMISHALRHPGASYTIKSHQTSHNVAYGTARSDLLALAEKGLLLQRRIGGKTLVFVAPQNLDEMLDKKGATPH